MPPLVARASAEFEKVIQELRRDIAALKARSPEPGSVGPAGRSGKDADCAAVTARVGLIENRLTMIESTLEGVPGIVAAYDERLRKLEAMLTPDASGRMTGLPPFWATFRDVETGEEWTVMVHLGDGFRDTPPKKLTPSSRGEGQ